MNSLLLFQAALTYTAYLRRQSASAYNQYADDVLETGQMPPSAGPAAGEPGTGYIDYYHDPSGPISGGFEAGQESSDFVSGGGGSSGGKRAGDSDLLAG